MNKYTSTHGLIPANEPSFRIDGQIAILLPGCGVATIHSHGMDDFTINRGTEGVHFDDLRVGQEISCDVGGAHHRVLHAHQQTKPLQLVAQKKSDTAGARRDCDIVA